MTSAAKHVITSTLATIHGLGNPKKEKPIQNTEVSDTCFQKSGNSYMPFPKAALPPILPQLPAGVYVIKASVTGLYLDMVDGFDLPPKLYGDINSKAERIISTFHSRPTTTGVLLTGEKGSGKTQLARLTATKFVEAGFPVLLVNSPFTGDSFNQLLQSIHQPTLVLFDEFEKVYGADDQPKMLTLLDGMFPSKKLFMFTCNEVSRIDSHMKNRPGRIFYLLDFNGLEEQFVREYCEDNLLNKENMEKLVFAAGMFQPLNFDTLKAIVEEMNRYNETPAEALKMLNAKPGHSLTQPHELKVTVDNNDVTRFLDHPRITGSPLTVNSFCVEWTIPHDTSKMTEEEKKSVGWEEGDDEIYFVNYEIRPTQAHLKGANPLKGNYIYEGKADLRIDGTSELTKIDVPFRVQVDKVKLKTWSMYDMM